MRASLRRCGVALLVVGVAGLPGLVDPSGSPARADPASASPSTAPPVQRVLPSRLVERRADPGPSAEAVLAGLTLRQQVGQLFMVGTPATSASAATRRAIRRQHVGNVMLTDRSYGGAAVPARVAAIMQDEVTAESTGGVRLLVATDQEGGLVQVLHGPGLSEIPSALEQGRWRPARLRRRAETWAGELRTAGVDMNLAPVADTVPSARAAADNPPIGAYDREFGYRATTVARHARAFARGMAARGVVPTVKHFPGLGRVHANTDTSAGVTDAVTTRHDAYLRPFRAAIDAGVPAVMMSTARYSRIDPRRPAAFSPVVLRGMLRHDLGFRGVVVSDDLANARQVAAWRPGARAVTFLRAGGDLVLAVSPQVLPAMYAAVLDRAVHHPSFRARVRASALRVLTLKERHGLLPGRG